MAYLADRPALRVWILVLLLATWPQAAWAESAARKTSGGGAVELIWESPKRRLRKDLSDPRLQPQPPFRFVEEDLGGSNPKMKIRDAKGRLWIVKWAEEIHSETFASRLVTALGYFARPTFFVRQGVIKGVRDLDRADPHVDGKGRFRNAVFKLIPEDEPYAAGVNWAWTDNPFLETPDGRRQLNGLNMLIMLTSNWDTKDTRDVARGANTAIYRTTGKGKTVRFLYALDDWGASMGRWGNVFTREKWDCGGYTAQTPEFVQGIEDGHVAWGFEGHHTDDITEGITVDDVRWLLQLLGRITDDQIAAALTSSGATRDDAECFGRAMRERIRQLQAVARPASAQTATLTDSQPSHRQGGRK